MDNRRTSGVAYDGNEWLREQLEERLGKGCRRCGRLRDLRHVDGLNLTLCTPCLGEVEDFFYRRAAEQPHLLDRFGFVYFAQREDGAIKIGMASNRRNLSHRVRRSGGTLLAVMPGGRGHEWRLHDAFRLYRRDGEWFRPRRRLLEYVEFVKAIR